MLKYNNTSVFFIMVHNFEIPSSFDELVTCQVILIYHHPLLIELFFLSVRVFYRYFVSLP
jgi:hypothetical protein